MKDNLMIEGRTEVVDGPFARLESLFRSFIGETVTRVTFEEHGVSMLIGNDKLEIRRGWEYVNVGSMNPLGAIWTSILDANSQPVGQVNPLGYTNTAVFDSAGRQIASVNPLGFRVSVK